ncbi:DUF4041 domain-containing protein [uncultured Draconibacterium sp.]|uniref:DUF4041 domain-containing protein n=1 Tax=uncultured Draconibacterium sp. TaxID=1573823 RepID=UPI0025E5D886|nr:DUF4041 domain-containing protein [uncultured Draconibacterium sp.]
MNYYELALIALAIVFVIILWRVVVTKNVSHKKIIQSIQNENDSKITELNREIDELSEYKQIVDAVKYANEIREKAESEYQKAQENIDEQLGLAEKEREELLLEAKEKAKELKAKAQVIMEKSNVQYATILEKAEERAKEIAGEAIEAKRNADHYEEAIKAMKNVIKGYGDEYLKPTHSLLDDLADEYSYKEAGIELKNARERTKLMITGGQAATCKYVETHRRTTAINFVLDAFNGKVEAILGRSKADNYGKLEQEMNDAFSLVNNNGKAFRDAVITKEYLDSRIDELHWAVRVHVLRAEEKEEQRKIREAIREEEKARREYEKAIREAEKEEKMLQKAMEKVRKQFEDASEQEKLKYQQELEELQIKLDEAEQKNQRALSMAQQTRRGHVYIISNVGSFGENVYKIGLTRRLEPLDRVKELGDASVPFCFDVHAMIHAEDAPSLEKSLHEVFQDSRVNKVNLRKEFFQVGIADIKSEIESQGIEAKWTLKAEAAEYRESLSMRRLLDIEKN